MGAQLRVVKKAPDFGVKRDYKISCSVFFFFLLIRGSLYTSCVLWVAPLCAFFNIFYLSKKSCSVFTPTLSSFFLT
jgi:hypothetical protein